MKLACSLPVIIAGCLCLASCATRKPAAPSPASPTKEENPAQKPSPLLVKRPAELQSVARPEAQAVPQDIADRSSAAQAAPYLPPPSRTDQVIRRVDASLESLQDGILIFQKSSSGHKKSQTGLFEDAIVLNRLRGAITTVQDAKDSAPMSVTVSRSCAYLKFGPGATASGIAKYINAALKTEGITRVCANVGSSS